MGNKTKKAPIKGHSMEALQEFGNAVAHSVKKDLGQDAISETWEQLFGIDLSADSSEKGIDKNKEEVALKDPKTGEVTIYKKSHTEKPHEKVHAKTQEKAHQPEKHAAINYTKEISENNISQNEFREISQRVQEIMVELKKLVQSSKGLQVQFSEVTVQDAPTEVGQYDINFFEWLLLTVKAAREKVENSGAWLSSVKGKNGKKGYWGMFKKHGTTFGLSNERVVATQTG